ncbi:M28 family metallopeptidase [Carboxylicivirga sp. N1Y90]|uniref:M28 family metallopeptidase n=1 Tax=Carboxylicivirga fragile TaxID=3417571 RepID=UPI003D32C6E5|nr:M28 family peptidase [Marinilabiliaceae bacterium N1Y90]
MIYKNSRSPIFYAVVLFMNLIIHDSQAQIKLEQHINLLTSPEFKGRCHLYGGADSTANYLSNIYQIIGLSALEPDFRQSFSITAFGRISNKSSITMDDKRYVIWDDFAVNPYLINWNQGQFLGEYQLYPFYKNDSVFLYRNSDSKDCLVRTRLTKELQEFKILVEGDTLADRFFGRKHITACLSNYMYKPDIILNPSPSMSRKLKRMAKNNAKATIKETVTINILRDASNYVCHNIVGQLATKANLDSTIIITAHYDHLGQGLTTYYPGANDNASGVSVMLEVASRLSKAVSQGWDPGYNIVFVAFGAEEYGLLGSEYFVESGLVDTSMIKCVLNLDMVGGLGTDLKDRAKALYLLQSDNVSQHCLQALLKADEKNTGVDFVLDGNPKYLKYSDQSSFIRRQIPSLFLFSGEDGVIHTVNDTSDLLDFEKMESLVEVLTDWIRSY